MLDVGVRRGVRIDVHVHRPRRRVDRRALTLVVGHGQVRPDVDRARGHRPAESILGLDREETAGVVLEVVDTQHDDLVGVRLRRDERVEGRRFRTVLPFRLGFPRRDACPPRARALDRLAEVEPGQVECRKLVVRAEDGHRHRAVLIVTEVVVVEVDSVRLGVELEFYGRILAGQIDLDQALTLVWIDPPSFFALCPHGAGECHSAQRNGEHQRSPHGLDAHRGVLLLTAVRLARPGPSRSQTLPAARRRLLVH
jgi:hypothetical protein